MNRFLLLAMLPLLLALPSAAEACAVCGGGTEDNRIEFIVTTAVLTFLPLGLMFGIFWCNSSSGYFVFWGQVLHVFWGQVLHVSDSPGATCKT